MSKNLKTTLTICFLSIFSSICAMAMENEDKKQTVSASKKLNKKKESRDINRTPMDAKKPKKVTAKKRTRLPKEMSAWLKDAPIEAKGDLKSQQNSFIRGKMKEWNID